MTSSWCRCQLGFGTADKSGPRELSETQVFKHSRLSLILTLRPTTAQYLQITYNLHFWQVFRFDFLLSLQLLVFVLKTGIWLAIHLFYLFIGYIMVYIPIVVFPVVKGINTSYTTLSMGLHCFSLLPLSRFSLQRAVFRGPVGPPL